jgi:hypothetical protein
VTVSESLLPPDKAGLVFFSTVSGSLCHEMRNVVAALNENAGLLGDFVLVGAKGRPVDPGRVDVVNQRVARFVARADRLLTSFSRLAHGMDKERGAVDLQEIAQDVVALGGRLIAASGREVQVGGQPGAVATTSPFVARLLLWRCLEAILADEGHREPTAITVAVTPGGAEMHLSAGDDRGAWRRRGIPDELELQLCALARCSMAVDETTGDLLIRWDAGTNDDLEEGENEA